MAFDGYFCRAVAAELNNYSGARVDKIRQSSPSAFYLSVFFSGSHLTLIISASAASPITAVTDCDTLKQDTPTPLCMLFRRHLTGARLSSAEALNGERVIRFTFDGTDDMGYPVKKLIYAEMMGKYSNIILCTEDGKILGATHLSDLTEGMRPMMTGVQYTLPPAQNKLSLSDIGETEFIALKNANENKKCASFLLTAFSCLSPLTAREIVFRACGDCDEVTANVPSQPLWDCVKAFVNDIENNVFTPYVCGNEYSFTKMTQYGENETANSFSELLINFYGTREKASALACHSHDITRTVDGALSRLRKKREKQLAELEESAEKDKFRYEGDLITANIYRIRKGDAAVSAIDYETGNEVMVPLDTRLTPAQNAQARYKRYAKLKRAAEELKTQLAKSASEVDYLESVLDCVTRATSVPEIDDIRRELCESGYIRSTEKARKAKQQLSKPLEFRTKSGYLLRIGRNNKQNDALTFSAAKDDIWFHVKGFHGSHVIMYAAGTEPDASDYTEAAMYAAWHSEKRGAKNIAVDYTRARYVKKPAGAAIGFVTYDRYYTAFVDAELPKGE